MRSLVLAAAVLTLVAAAQPAVAWAPSTSPSAFLRAHQAEDGGVAEEGGAASPGLTAWTALGLLAAGRSPGHALDYLEAHALEVTSPPTRALVALAAAALGSTKLAAELPLTAGQTNTVTWTILARRQAGLSAPQALVRVLLDRQRANGGWGWTRGVSSDSNDTAAVVQALRSTGVTGRPVRRALAYLRSLRKANGGFALVPGREPDAQSTAWAVQAFVAAGERPPPGALSFLRSLQRPDGSFRYSARYAVTPVWVTAQVLPALAGRPFPLPR